MRILVVLKSFSTHDRQNALCVEAIIKKIELMQRNIHVDYVSWEYKQSVAETSCFFPIYTQKNNNCFRKFYYYVYKFIHMPIGNKEAVTKLKLKILELVNKRTYNAIIAVINPTEAAEAVVQIKKEFPKIKFILYEIDPNSNRYKGQLSFIHKIWKQKSIKWEINTYNAADYIIHMQTHQKHFSSSIYKDFISKTIYLDIPNFQPQRYDVSTIMNNNYQRKIKLLYGGAFYPVLREPYFMVKLFGVLSKKLELSLDIYTGLSMRVEMEQLAISNDFLYLHDEVSEKELLKIISESDVLISVGNKDSDFLPSKTLMYMSIGKPIIHFYSDENDVSIEYYKHYPAILLIDQRKKINEICLDDIITFLNNSKNKVMIDWDTLKERLKKNTPEYSAKVFLELINE